MQTAFERRVECASSSFVQHALASSSCTEFSDGHGVGIDFGRTISFCRARLPRRLTKSRWVTDRLPGNLSTCSGKRGTAPTTAARTCCFFTKSAAQMDPCCNFPIGTTINNEVQPCLGMDWSNVLSRSLQKLLLQSSDGIWCLLERSIEQTPRYAMGTRCGSLSFGSAFEENIAIPASNLFADNRLGNIEMVTLGYPRGSCGSLGQSSAC